MFKVSVTPTSLTLTHKANGSKIVWKIEGKSIVREKSDTASFGTKRESDCATHTHKFVSDLVSSREFLKGNIEKRLALAGDALKQFSGINSYRTLNNTLRRHFDPGTPEFFGAFFYEGTAKHALKPRKVVEVVATTPVVKEEAIPKKKATVATKKVATKKVATKKVATPKKKSTAKKATVVDATTQEESVTEA